MRLGSSPPRLENPKSNRTQLPARFRKLVDKLYSPEGEPAGRLVPELVDAIQALGRVGKVQAEEFLLLIMHSPSVHRLPSLGSPPYGVKSGVRAEEQILDAAGAFGPFREEARAVLRLLRSKRNFSIGHFLEKPLRPETKALATKAQRARKEMGLNQKPGRPRNKNPQK